MADCGTVVQWSYSCFSTFPTEEATQVRLSTRSSLHVVHLGGMVGLCRGDIKIPDVLATLRQVGCLLPSGKYTRNKTPRAYVHHGE